MIETDELIRDLKEIEADMKVTFDFLSVSYEGSMSSLQTSKDMRDFGFLPQASTEIVARIDQFGQVPAPDDEITITHINFTPVATQTIRRIESFERHQDGVVATIRLAANN